MAQRHKKRQEKDFEEAASQKRPTLVGEFLQFLRHNRKWWLTPIIVVLLLAGLLVILQGTGFLPFIYALL